MSATTVRAHYLRCDGCERIFQLAGSSLFWDIPRARDAARIRGWTYTEGKDHCDKCTKRLAA